VTPQHPRTGPIDTPDPRTGPIAGPSLAERLGLGVRAADAPDRTLGIPERTRTAYSGALVGERYDHLAGTVFAAAMDDRPAPAPAGYESMRAPSPLAAEPVGGPRFLYTGPVNYPLSTLLTATADPRGDRRGGPRRRRGSPHRSPVSSGDRRNG
jgi:hypothetical protein